MTEQPECDALPVWNRGNDFLPFHPQASHVGPDYRDGWNNCFERAQAEISRLKAELEAAKLAAQAPAQSVTEAMIDAALDELVAEGEPVRFYLEAYAFERDDETTRQIMTREVIRTALTAALATHPPVTQPQQGEPK